MLFSCVSLHHQVEHVALDQRVEGRGRLVGDEKRRLQQHDGGEHDTLAHAAGKLMREGGKAARRVLDADALQHGEAPVADLGLAELPVQRQTFGHLPGRSSWRGLSETIGSWNTMPMPAPRISRIFAGSALTRSVPLKRIRLSGVAMKGGGRRPSTERAAMVLPEPDSPTSASISPAGREKERPSTTVRPACPMRTERFSTESTVSIPAMGSILHLGVEPVAHRIAEQVHAEQRDGDAEAGQDDDMRRLVDVGGGLLRACCPSSAPVAAHRGRGRKRARFPTGPPSRTSSSPAP